jgi:hypothetical protein
MNTSDRDIAIKLFEKQIECIMNDDREGQMQLFTEDIRYEFPFANDRPRLIEGREAFRNTMEPLWAEARKRGLHVIGYTSEFHATDEPGLFLVIFDLNVKITENTVTLPFVQLIRIQDNYIIAIKEYFNPSARKAAVESVVLKK